MATSKFSKSDASQLVALLTAVISWDEFFVSILPDHIDAALVIVVHDSCDDSFTYQVQGQEVLFLGNADLHDTKYTKMGMYTDFAPFLPKNANQTQCTYDLRIYPTHEFRQSFIDSTPWIFALVVFFVFLLTTLVFFLYDYFVYLRQEKVMAAAKQTGM
jgi:hypothetical protein